MFDVQSSRIDLVFASWSFERLSGFGDGPLTAVGIYIQASLCIWLLLASCSGVLHWLPCSFGS
ncbi:hypothetical protein V2W45_1405657, partial [Cenococcum geophilum]